MDTTDESRYEGSVANYDYKWDVEQIESLQFSHSVFESNEEELFFPEIDNQLLCCLLRSIGPAGSLRRLECIVGKHTILKIANLLATSQTLTYLSVFFAPTKKSLKRQLFQAIKKSSTLRTLRIRDTPGRKYDDEFIEIFRCNSVLEELILVDEHVESGVTLNEYWSEILEGIRTNATSRMKSVFDECGHRERELVLVYEFKFTKRFVKLYVYSGNWQNLEFVRNAISALETNTEIDWVVLQSYSDWPDFPNL
ncbi:hypothetical protein HK098_002621 [Nowakowskiella sp. JEL0407]|nr:hypothetical protein HK098_002621 [Nowakowskiella sp. JEL0407]